MPEGAKSLLDAALRAVMLWPGLPMGANRFRRGQRTFRRMQGTLGPLQKTGNATNANDNVELALAA